MRWPAEIKNGTRWYRSSTAGWVRSATMLATSVLVGLILALPGPHLQQHHLVDHRAFGFGFLGVAPVVSAFLSALQLRSGIGISADGVIVRTALGWTYRAAWNEVDHFVLAREYQGQQGHYQMRPLLISRSGKPRSTIGCDFGSGAGAREQARRVVASLEAARLVWQEHNASAGPQAAEPAPVPQEAA